VAAAATTPTSSSFVPAEAGRTGTDLAKLFSNPRLLLLLGSDPSLLLQAPSLSLQTLALEPRFELGLRKNLQSFSRRRELEVEVPRASASIQGINSSAPGSWASHGGIDLEKVAVKLRPGRSEKAHEAELRERLTTHGLAPARRVELRT